MIGGVFTDNAPRKKLWAAVLLQAIRDVAHPKGMGDADPDDIRREAQRFFMSPDLEEVCELAAMDEVLSAGTIRAAYKSGALHKIERMVLNYATATPKGEKR